MKFFKFELVVAALVCVSATAMASPPETPEFNLLQGMYAIQGESISQDQKVQDLRDLLDHYDVSAPQENRIDRLTQAMVELHLYSPAQAEALAESARIESAKLGETSDEGQIDSAILRVASVTPKGAQFSCDIGVGVTATLLTGGAGLLVFGLVDAIVHSFNGGHGFVAFLAGSSATGAGLLTIAVLAAKGC